MCERELYINKETYNKKTNEVKTNGICIYCGSNCTHIVVVT